jgi:hypothetical protein
MGLSWVAAIFSGCATAASADMANASTTINICFFIPVSPSVIPVSNQF